MVRSKIVEDEEDNFETASERKFSRLAIVDKIAMACIAAILSFILTQIWAVKNEFAEITKSLEIRYAEIVGEQKQIVETLKMLVTNGSHSAQRTEVLVQGLESRMTRFEEFMNKGRRFTADDGDKLEKRIGNLEDKISGLKSSEKNERIFK